MRIFVACAIVLATAIGVAGCFHHQQAVVQEPMPPLK
jgi:hypothetical protein